MSFNLDEYLADLETIVNIDSGSSDIAGIEKVADFFADKYREIDYNVERHFVNSDTGCSLVVTNTESSQYDVLLIGHMDTVFPPGTAAERPFSIKSDRAYGPGVIDMKSGLLLIYYILREIKQKSSGSEPAICAILNGDEEIGSKSSRTLIKEKAKKSKIALVLEPARATGDCVLERKGISGYNLKFKGKAAHAGVEPEKGASTVVELANWIIELDKLNNYEAGTSVNIGVIAGGSATNVIPEYASAGIDLRFKSESELKRVEAKLEELKKSPHVEGVHAEVIHRGMRPLMKPSQVTMKLWDKIEEIGEKFGLEMNWVATGGGSDANFTAGEGIPTVDGMGPAGGRPHSVDEYLEIKSIEPRFNLLVELLMFSKEFK